MQSKKILLALVLFINLLSFGQTNTFPATGNVGIGTTNPQAKLDIAFEGEPKTIKFLEYGNAVRSMNSLMRFTWYNDTADFGMVRSGSTPIEALAIRFNAVEKMRIMSNGNLGVGTSTPSAKLDVNGDGHFKVADDPSVVGALTIETNNGTNLKLGGNTTYSWIQSHNSKPLYINELGNNTIFNLANGNVGIGTTGQTHVR